MMRGAVIGQGAAAQGWAARLVLFGYDAAVFGADAGPTVARARRSLPGLYDVALPDAGALIACDDPAVARDGANWVLTEQAEGGSIFLLQGSGLAHAVEVETAAPHWLTPLALLGPASAEDAAVAAEFLISLGMRCGSGAGAMAQVAAALDTLRMQLGAQGMTPAQIDQMFAEGIAPSLEHDDDDAVRVGLARVRRSSYRANSAQYRAYERARQADRPTIGPHPVPTLAMQVPQSWTDYNGHMTEAEYLTAFGYATDGFFPLIGVDAEYVAQGQSFFTVETHIRHLDEVLAGAPIAITTQVLVGAGKKLSLWHEMRSGARLLATAEHMLIHVDLASRSACAPRADVASKIEAAAAAHAALPVPEGKGRAIGQRAGGAVS